MPKSRCRLAGACGRGTAASAVVRAHAGDGTCAVAQVAPPPMRRPRPARLQARPRRHAAAAPAFASTPGGPAAAAAQPLRSPSSTRSSSASWGCGGKDACRADLQWGEGSGAEGQPGSAAPCQRARRSVGRSMASVRAALADQWRRHPCATGGSSLLAARRRRASRGPSGRPPRTRPWGWSWAWPGGRDGPAGATGAAAHARCVAALPARCMEPCTGRSCWLSPSGPTPSGTGRTRADIPGLPAAAGGTAPKLRPSA